MKNQLFFAFSVAALISGCNGNGMSGGGTDMAMNPPGMDLAMAAMDPVKPALATTQIERMGRATINVAVTNPFNLDYSALGAGANTNAESRAIPHGGQSRGLADRTLDPRAYSG